MALDWQKLTELTHGGRIEVERVRLPETGVAIEGPFALPPLAQLSFEDQVFIIAFIRTHGSIKEMEQLFGVSYPTIKNRLNRIASQFEYVEVKRETGPELPATAADHRKRILDDLEHGRIDAAQAVKALKEVKP